MNVTREDVKALLETIDSGLGDASEALIEAFPHLVGEVTDLTGHNDPLNVPPYKKERTIYTVTGDWKESK